MAAASTSRGVLLAGAVLLAGGAALGDGATLDRRIVARLRVNDADRGEVFAVVGSRGVLLKETELPRAEIDASALRAPRVRIGGEDYVPLDALPPTMRYRLDEETATLALTVPPDALPVRRVDLASRFQGPKVVPRSAPSAFLNYGVHARGANVGGSAELGVRVGRALAGTTASWSPVRGVVRGFTHVTVDEPERLLRITAGDFFSASGPLGGGAVMGGVRVAREFGLDPYFRRAPSVSSLAAVEVPSTIDVYSNGVLVSREQVAPGQISFENLPVVRGNGETRLVIRDAFGREREVVQPYYATAGLLAPGVSDFEVAAGFARQELATDSFNYGGPASAMRFRHGASDAVTVGARLELSAEIGSGGPVVGFRLPAGELELAAAASADSGDAGAAGSVTYSYFGPRLQLGAYLRAASARYANLSWRGSADRPSVEGGVDVSTPLARRWTAGLAVQAARWRDGGSSGRGGAFVSATFWDRVGMRVSGSYGNLHHEPPAFEASLTLTATFDGGFGGAVAAGAGPAGPFAAIDASRTPPATGGFGGRLHASADRDFLALGQVEHLGAHGRILGGAHLYQGTPTLFGEATGGLIAADGAVFATQVVNQGFAVLHLPDMAGVRGYLNNHEIGRTDRSGRLIITGLTPYYANRISISHDDLPADAYSPVGEEQVAPFDRGGVVVTLGVRRIRAVRGRAVVRDESGALVPPAFGELALEDGPGLPEDLSPVGRNGEFEFEGLSSGPRDGWVTWRGGRCHLEFAVPESAEPVVDVGTVECRR